MALVPNLNRILIGRNRFIGYIDFADRCKLTSQRYLLPTQVAITIWRIRLRAGGRAHPHAGRFSGDRFRSGIKSGEAPIEVLKSAEWLVLLKHALQGV